MFCILILFPLYKITGIYINLYNCIIYYDINQSPKGSACSGMNTKLNDDNTQCLMMLTLMLT